MSDVDLLVGSTGFVGGNLTRSHDFANAVHSTNVQDAFGMRPDLCVYAGIPSAMFLANQHPEEDLALMDEARKNLRQISPKKVALISTIAVYDDSRGKDELSPMRREGLSAYGANRLQLEKWVREDFPDALIVRLPALYGHGLKKNFIKDMISVAPPLLKEAKYLELADSSDVMRASYAPRGDGFYAVKPDADMPALKGFFSRSGFNALSFTDSRSRFQFYDLSRLWDDIREGLAGGYEAFNLATPPVSAAEVYEHVRGGSWSNELDVVPFDYDMRTIHSADGSGYLCTKQAELDGIKSFVEAVS